MIFKLILFKTLALFRSLKTSRLTDLIDFYLQLKHLAISQWDMETKEVHLELARLRQQNQSS